MVRINAGCTGEFFLTQGRPQFNLSGCVILCITRYRLHASSEEFQDEMLVGSSPNWHSLRHAEEYAIGGIEKIETYLNCKAVRVEMYGSYSPCSQCCETIMEFLYRRPGCKVAIAFTCLYKGFDEVHCSALRQLYRHKAVTRLDVFTATEWRLLEARKHVALSPYLWQFVKWWDLQWWRKLKEILLPIMAMDQGRSQDQGLPLHYDITAVIRDNMANSSLLSYYYQSLPMDPSYNYEVFVSNGRPPSQVKSKSDETNKITRPNQTVERKGKSLSHYKPWRRLEGEVAPTHSQPRH